MPQYTLWYPNIPQHTPIYFNMPQHTPRCPNIPQYTSICYYIPQDSSIYPQYATIYFNIPRYIPIFKITPTYPKYTPTYAQIYPKIPQYILSHSKDERLDTRHWESSFAWIHKKRRRLMQFRLSTNFLCFNDSSKVAWGSVLELLILTWTVEPVWHNCSSIWPRGTKGAELHSCVTSLPWKVFMSARLQSLQKYIDTCIAYCSARFIEWEASKIAVTGWYDECC